MGDLRQCSICKEFFPQTAEYFYADKKKPSGFRAGCKKCLGEKRKANPVKNNERARRYREKNHDRVLAHERKRREENREEYKRKTDEYVKKNHERILERSRQYREEHREERKRKSAEYYAKNREKCIRSNLASHEKNRDKRTADIKRKLQEEPDRFREYQKKYYENHKDRVESANKRWRENNPEKHRLIYQRRRHRKAQLACTLTAEQWMAICEHFDNKCAYCGKEAKLTQEHFVPLSAGGEYTHNNIIPACGSCNSSKLNKPFAEWYPKQKFYSKRREKRILRFLNYDESGTQQLQLVI